MTRLTSTITIHSKKQTIIGLLLCFPLVSVSQHSPNQEKFIAAEKALKNNQLTTFETLKTQLHENHYSLAGFLDAAALSRLFSQEKFPIHEVHDFLAIEHNTALGARLRSAWLYHLAKHNRWAQFSADFIPTDDVALNCYEIYARYKNSGDPSVLADAQNYWLQGKSQPPACNNTFEAWKKTGGLTEALVWERLKLATEANQYPVVNFLMRYVPEAKKPVVQTWLNTYRDPKIITSEKLFKGSDPFLRETQLYGLKRIARRDPAQAAKIWGKIEKKFNFSPVQTYHAYRIIAVGKAMAHQDDALSWFEKTPIEYYDAPAFEWHVRAALSNNRWEDVLTLIPQFPETIRSENTWNYWLARAYENLGKKSQARSIYKELSKERSFTGILASDRLNIRYPLHLPVYKISEKNMEKTLNNIGIARAMELHEMGRITHATREWTQTTALLPEEQLQAAAQIAFDNHWQERALFTLAKAENQNNLDIRFPVLYRETIEIEANRQKIDPAWVFAIARRESAFIPNARSPVGASGLMQLMPYTAKQIAKDAKVNYSSPAQLTNPKTNIKLGSAYLQQVYKKLGENMILATAAYNAGPARVKQWLPSQPLEADIWIENIPFTETREYVKAVMVYRMIYQDHLNINGRLKDNMGEIS